MGVPMGKYGRNSQNAWLLLIGLVVAMLPDVAFASTDNDQLLAMLHKLEARVEVCRYVWAFFS